MREAREGTGDVADYVNTAGVGGDPEGAFPAAGSELKRPDLVAKGVVLADERVIVSSTGLAGQCTEGKTRNLDAA